MTNIDVTDVPETDAEVDAVLDAANSAPTPEAEATPDVTPPPAAPVAPAPRTGNAAWADKDVREMVGQFMDALRVEGYTRPELSAITGYNDSTVYRAQRRKVHTHEVEHWMNLVFEPYKNGTLLQTNPPAKSLKTPKPEVLLAKIGDIEAKIARAVEALANPDVKTVKDFRALVTEVTETLSA